MTPCIACKASSTALLKRTTARYSRRTSRCCPAWPADEASLIETNRRLAAGLEPFNLDLTVPEAGTTFFQCIYMRVAENPSLSRTRQAAGKAFALPADDYMPHLSLYYGDVSPERRATILATVPAQAKCSFPVESIQLIRADSERPVDWHCIDEAPLGSGARPIPS